MCIYIYLEHSLSIKTVKSKDQDKFYAWLDWRNDNNLDLKLLEEDAVVISTGRELKNLGPWNRTENCFNFVLQNGILRLLAFLKLLLKPNICSLDTNISLKLSGRVLFFHEKRNLTELKFTNVMEF
jgi:hypothetical protein